jgi:cytochrome P450
VSKDVTVGPVTMRAGERVLLLTYAANNRAGGFDLDRPYDPDTRQLWFGAGRHLCLGAALARAEVTQLVEAVLGAAGPVRIVERRPARGVLIPSYAALRVVTSSPRRRSSSVSAGSPAPSAPR